MVIAALVAFAILLIAWLAAPSGASATAGRKTETESAVLAEAA